MKNKTWYCQSFNDGRKWYRSLPKGFLKLCPNSVNENFINKEATYTDIDFIIFLIIRFWKINSDKLKRFFSKEENIKWTIQIILTIIISIIGWLLTVAIANQKGEPLPKEAIENK